MLEALPARRVCEIGVQSGAGTRRLIEYVREHDGHLVCIDPAYPDDWHTVDAEGVVTYEATLSLEALPRIERCDAYLVDGDHNYYTVSNELRLIERAHADQPTIVALHDVAWPYGRRDLYYDPSTIPESERHPHRAAGIVIGASELDDTRGINAHLANAMHEGGPRNGVLTAVEDFVAEHPDWGLDLVPGIHGLAYLCSPATPERVRIEVRRRSELTPEARALAESIEDARLRGASQTAERIRFLERDLAATRAAMQRAERERVRLARKLAHIEARTEHRLSEGLRALVRRARG